MLCLFVCRLVSFCAVLRRLKSIMRFCIFGTSVEAGGRHFVPCCVVLCLLCHFVSLKDRRAILQIVHKRRGWKPLLCAVLCLFVLFCVV